jgi:hypothetical protein
MHLALVHEHQLVADFTGEAHFVVLMKRTS